MAEDRAGQVERLVTILDEIGRGLYKDWDEDIYSLTPFAERLIERGVTVQGAAPPPPKVTDAMLDAALRVIEEDPESGWGMTATHQGDLALLRRALEAAWRAASSGEA